MAVIRANPTPKPIEIDKWLGVNEAVGDTEIKLGEAVLQENFRITKNYKPQKRPGHHTYINCGSSQIRGAWYGVLNGVKTLLFAHGGNLYKRDVSIDVPNVDLADLLSNSWDDSIAWDDSVVWDESGTPPVTLIGAINDSKTQFLWFNGVVLIRNAVDYKQYDGTTYQDVVSYIPTIAISAPPTGGGTLFEEENLLTGYKKQEFIATSATVYQLADTNIDNGTVTATISGVATTAFTVNNANGTVTFTTAPTTGAKVIIQWSKAVTGNRAIILGHAYAIDYGVSNDTNIFLFGNSNEKNVFRYSMVGNAGYFPANQFVKVGSDQFSITDLVPQYQSLLVFKNGDGTKIVRPTVNPAYANNTGLNPYNFPYFDLNEAVGNIAQKGVQLIENNPISLYGSSMWLWSSATGIEDERNAKIISDRIKLSLQDVDLSQAITYDNQDEKEYWCAVGGKVYIFNYGNDTMYMYTNINSQEFFKVDGDLCYIDGFKIERFKREYLADGATLGTTIPCILKGGFSDFGSLEYRKIMRDEWLAISPSTRTSVELKFVTDKVYETDAKTYSVFYNIMNFNDVDFNDFSFLGNINPQPNRLTAKVKKFTYLQYIFENNTNNEDLTVVKLLLQAQAQSLSK